MAHIWKLLWECRYVNPCLSSIGVDNRGLQCYGCAADPGDSTKSAGRFLPSQGCYVAWIAKFYLCGGNSKIFGIFTRKIGEMIQFDEHIFQMGWNHQLVNGLMDWWIGHWFLFCWGCLPGGPRCDSCEFVGDRFVNFESFLVTGGLNRFDSCNLRLFEWLKHYHNKINWQFCLILILNLWWWLSWWKNDSVALPTKPKTAQVWYRCSHEFHWCGRCKFIDRASARWFQQHDHHQNWCKISRWFLIYIYICFLFDNYALSLYIYE